MDVLSDVLQTLQLRETVYLQAEFRSPWAMTLGGGEFANFHVVMSGECWLRMRDEPPLRLAEGDLVLFPHGAEHTLQNARELTTVPATSLGLSHRDEGTACRVFGGQGRSTMLLCGHFEVDRAAVHPLLGSLPRLLHLKAVADPERESLLTMARLAAAESERGGPAANAMVNRLAEVLMIRILRIHASREHDGPSFLATLGNPDLARALQAIHRDPAHPWTVGGLAAEAAMSRSAFALRFRQCAQMGPMEYVTHWRMQRAGYLLSTTEKTTIEVACETGYASEASFSRAFRRIHGHGPGQSRRLARPTRLQQIHPAGDPTQRDHIPAIGEDDRLASATHGGA